VFQIHPIQDGFFIDYMANAIISGRLFPLYRQKKNQEKVLTFFDLCGIIQMSSEEMTDMKILL